MTNNERMTRSGHRKDNPRKKTPVSLIDQSDFFEFAIFLLAFGFSRDLRMLSDNCIH